MKKTTKELLFERMHTIGGGMPLNEKIEDNIINEALEDIDNDINLIYNKYFKIDIEKFNQTHQISDDMFKKEILNTSILKRDSFSIISPNDIQRNLDTEPIDFFLDTAYT